MKQLISFDTQQLQPLHPAQVLARAKSRDIKANLQALWDCKYPADPILEPELEGMTFGQVAQYRQVMDAARGIGEAFDRVTDRLIGKPAQINTNVNVNASYKDFLDEVAQKEGIIDADVVPRGNESEVTQEIQ